MDTPCSNNKDQNYRCSPDVKTSHSYTVGERGPVLAEDTVLHETLDNFVHSTMLERVVHTKGYGAFGYFENYQSMEDYTRAGFLQKAGQRTPVFSRFSLAVSTKGTPDTSRNVRGFSTKFYTETGVFDLLCNHIPVFLVRDGIRFPESIKALSPSPVNNLADPNLFWDFFAKAPEATHFVTWLYSDFGTVKSLRHIPANSVNTYVWVNWQGQRRYVKYQWIPAAGIQYIDNEESVKLAGENPDIAGQDLYDTLASGNTVEYELCVQLMNPEDENILPYDPLDDTKIWSETEYPLMPVGRLVLTKNPDNYRSQVEKASFAPSNLTDGIELSNDKMLQGRATVYWDAQRHRLGPDFRKIPVNQMADFDPTQLVTSGVGQTSSGVQMRSDIPKEDNFTQAGERYYALSEEEKDHLVDNIASQLYLIKRETRDCALSYFEKASVQFSRKIKERMDWYARKQ